MEKTYTHKELARLLAVSETTIKSYRKKFASCIPVANLGKPIRFTDSALQVCRRIRDYFTAGMSVEEVRARLAQEFSWIAPLRQEKNGLPKSVVTLPQDFTLAISNLAKSMVTLTQQQRVMLKRMHEIETMLGRVIDATHGQETAQQQVVSSHPSSMEQESEVKAYHFPQPVHQERHEQGQQNEKTPQDFPRHLLALPLVVRTEQGGYTGAGGRSRGRFTLNDLKALLAYGRNTAEHYAMHWEYAKDGSWWLTLEQLQTETPQRLRLQLKELSTQRGIAVAEVTQLVSNDRRMHPAELCAFVSDLSGGR